MGLARRLGAGETLAFVGLGAVEFVADVAVGGGGAGGGVGGGVGGVAGGGGEDALGGGGMVARVEDGDSVGDVGDVGTGDGEVAVVGVELVVLEEGDGLFALEGDVGTTHLDDGGVGLVGVLDALAEAVETEAVAAAEVGVEVLAEDELAEGLGGGGGEGLREVGVAGGAEAGDDETAAVGEGVEAVLDGVDAAGGDAEARDEDGTASLVLLGCEVGRGDLRVDAEEGAVGNEAVGGLHDGACIVGEGVPEGDETTDALAAAELGRRLVGGLGLVAAAGNDVVAATVEGEAHAFEAAEDCGGVVLYLCHGKGDWG